MVPSSRSTRRSSPKGLWTGRPYRLRWRSQASRTSRCTPSVCQGSNVADCYPAGSDPYDQTLPQGALQFGPGVGDATLEATFTCYPGPSYPGPTYSLTVDLTWSGQVIG